MEKKRILGLTETKLKDYCRKNGYREFHGNQIFRWIYNRFPDSFDEMTDLPESLRENLKDNFVLGYLSPDRRLVSRKKDAVKYSLMLDKNQGIEAVILFDKNNRSTFCISSQIGCPVGCGYCATGRMGFKRNLRSDEIINEVLSLSKLNKRPSSIVFMGMGEPLLNYNEVIKAIEFLKHIRISDKRITLSTCGIIKRIYDLANSGLRPRLAVSIGSAIEEKRRAMIPISEENNLKKLKDAILFYRGKTRRKVTLEYTIIEGLNDTKTDVYELSRFANQTSSHVNLIRFNQVEGSGFKRPGTKTVNYFKAVLKSKGIDASERYRRGNDIDAACGQLILKLNKKNHSKEF